MKLLLVTVLVAAVIALPTNDDKCYAGSNALCTCSELIANGAIKSIDDCTLEAAISACKDGVCAHESWQVGKGQNLFLDSPHCIHARVRQVTTNTTVGALGGCETKYTQQTVQRPASFRSWQEACIPLVFTIVCRGTCSVMVHTRGSLAVAKQHTEHMTAG